MSIDELGGLSRCSTRQLGIRFGADSVVFEKDFRRKDERPQLE